MVYRSGLIKQIGVPYRRSFNRSRRPGYSHRRKLGYKPRAVGKSVVAKIAKQVVLKTAEHKARNVLMTGASIYNGQMLGMNPLYWIPQDDTITGRTGAKIQDVVLHIQGRYKHIGAKNNTVPPTYPWESSTLRMMVFATDLEWRNTSETTLSDIQYSGVGDAINYFNVLIDKNEGNADICFPNLKTMKLLYDKKIYCPYRSTHQTDGGNVTELPNQAGSYRFDCKVPLGDRYYQAGGGLSFTKLKQIIVCFTTGCPTPLPNDTSLGVRIDEVGSVDCQYLVTYKDF